MPPPHRSRSLRSTSGQASVELVALLPVVLLVVAFAWQAVLAGQAVWNARVAARAAARAHSFGADAATPRAPTSPPVSSVVCASPRTPRATCASRSASRPSWGCSGSAASAPPPTSGRKHDAPRDR